VTNRDRRSRGERGQASLEVVALLPVLLVVGLLAFQAGVAIWTISSTTEAARAAARAYSLGRDPQAAADASLPGSLQADVTTFGPGFGVELTVKIPQVTPVALGPVVRRVVMP
jgi:hypothetical protein